MFQTSRVARPQDASKAHYLVSLPSSSARSYLDSCKQRMLRFVSEVDDTETWLGPASHFVDPVFQHSPRHNMGFVHDLVEAGSIGFVEDAIELVDFLFVAKKAGAQRFIVDALASNRHFSEPPSGPLRTGDGLVMSNFRVKTLKLCLWVWPVSRTRFINVAFLDGYMQYKRFPLFMHPKLVFQERRSIENVLRLFDLSCTCYTTNRFFLGDVFLSGCHRPLHTRRNC